MKVNNRIISDCEWAVDQLQKDLKYLAENKKGLSVRFYNKQNKIIKSIINYYNWSQQEIEFLKAERLDYYKAKRSQIQKLEDRILAFECICIIHGIMDFPSWLARGRLILLSKAEELGKTKKMQLPFLFNEKLDNLPKSDREYILNILQKDINAQLKEVLARMGYRIK